MAEETTTQEIMEAVTALRDMTDKKSTEYKENITTINAFLDNQEKINQKNLADLKTSETREIELKERFDAIELELARKTPSVKGDYKETQQYKALHDMCVKGDLMDLELKAILRTDIDPQGGYTVMSELDNMITKKITEISGIRSVARVRTIATKTLEMPIRATLLAATYEGEGGTSQESNSTYSSESLTAFRQTVTVPITQDLLMDSAFNMESEILGDGAEAFAQGEGNKFILGTDFKQPEGITVNPVLVATPRISGNSGVIDADDMILLTGDLKVGYNPVYTFNRQTLATLRTLKSTTGSFLWQPGLNGPVLSTLNGFPYVISQDMPAIASDSLSVAFGDFLRGYTIIDRTGITIVRDELTRKKESIVEFTINRWNYGKVTLPEAIKLLKTKT